MKTLWKPITLTAVILGSSLATTSHAKVNLPPASPLQTINQKVGYADLSLSYSRPISRGREVFGNLVPYETLWRMGANWATVLTVSEDFSIGEHALPAGAYSLLCVPGEKQWTMILNSKTEEFWPPAGYDESEDVIRFSVDSANTHQNFQELNFQFVDLSYDGVKLRMNWEQTQVEFELKFDTYAKAEAEIAKQLQDPDAMKRGDYGAIATFYHLSGKNLEDALAFYDKAIENSKQTPYWIMFHKAETLAKLGRVEEAIALAKETIEISKSDSVWGPKYADWSQKLISSLN